MTVALEAEDDEPSGQTSLIPNDAVSAGALTVIIAILTFLAALAAGGAVLLANASARWSADVARELVVQVKPGAAVDIDASVAQIVTLATASPIVASVRTVGAEETAAELRPWLGSNLDLKQLPIPRLVVLDLENRDPTALAELRARIAHDAPDAVIDDHSVWLQHLAGIGSSLTLFASLLFLLIAAAVVTAVAFATRSAMAGAREIIEVLRYVGASDGFIVGQFERYFFRLSARGTALGGGAAAVCFLIATLFGRTSSGDDSASLPLLLGAFRLPFTGYVGIAVCCAGVAAATSLFSRRIASAHLRKLDYKLD